MSELTSTVLPRAEIDQSKVTALLKRFRAGDRASFDQIVRATQDDAYVFALEITGGNEEDAQDGLQTAYLKIYQDIDILQDETYFATWLQHIVSDCCIDKTIENLTAVPAMGRSIITVVDNLRQTAVQLADDVGLIDEESLRDHLPHDEWDYFYPELIRRCGFHRISGQLALRDTVKVRAKAALLSIGRISSKDEIALLSGIDVNRISSVLYLIPSVARADKSRWGLTQWIDDIYEGIPAEIQQRVEEDGGATTLERLLDELPRLFNVSESSVLTYVGTPKFILQDGIVRLRQSHEPYSYDNSDIHNTPGVFALDTGRVSLLYVVDNDVLRGSGRKLAIAAGKILDLTVNERLQFAGPNNITVTISFPETSPTGPSLGSTRALAEITGAKLGNLLTVTFDGTEKKVTAISTDPTEHSPGWELVARLTGIDKKSGMGGLANALNCAQSEVRATLRERGDSVVLDALPLQQPSNELVKALAELDAEMERSRL